MFQICYRNVLLITLLSQVVSSQVLALDGVPASAQVETNQSIDHAVQQAWVRAIANDQAAGLKRLVSLHDPAKLLALTAGNGKSALMVAGKVGDLPLVTTLVSAGARIDDMTQTNGTALMFAVLGNQRRVAEWLVGRGADIHVIGSNGWTALTIAAAKGYLGLMQWLVEQGADAQVRDVYRYTPLMRAVENDHEPVVAALLSLRDTDVNVQDEYGNTSLHHAVSARNTSMVRLLLQHGAETDIQNRNGMTALMLTEGSPDLQSLFR